MRTRKEEDYCKSWLGLVCEQLVSPTLPKRETEKGKDLMYEALLTIRGFRDRGYSRKNYRDTGYLRKKLLGYRIL